MAFPSEQEFIQKSLKKLVAFLDATEHVKDQLCQFEEKCNGVEDIPKLQHIADNFVRPVGEWRERGFNSWQVLLLSALCNGAITEVFKEVVADEENQTEYLALLQGGGDASDLMSNYARNLANSFLDGDLLNNSNAGFSEVGKYEVSDSFKQVVSNRVQQEESKLSQSDPLNNNQPTAPLNFFQTGILLLQAKKVQENFLGFSLFVIALFSVFSQLTTKLVSSAKGGQFFGLFPPHRREEEDFGQELDDIGQSSKKLSLQSE